MQYSKQILIFSPSERDTHFFLSFNEGHTLTARDSKRDSPNPLILLSLSEGHIFFVCPSVRDIYFWSVPRRGTYFGGEGQKGTEIGPKGTEKGQSLGPHAQMGLNFCGRQIAPDVIWHAN